MRIDPPGSQPFPLAAKKIQVKGSGFHQQLQSASYDGIFTAAGDRWRVPPAVLKAIARTESGLNPQARSPAGACGMMQLMPETARSLGVRDIFDPEENIFAGARYFRTMLDRFDGDTRLALAAYNAGPGNVQKYGGVPPFKETQRYVQKILAAVGDNLGENLGISRSSNLQTATSAGIPPAHGGSGPAAVQASADALLAAGQSLEPEELSDYIRLWSETRLARLTIRYDDENESG